MQRKKVRPVRARRKQSRREYTQRDIVSSVTGSIVVGGYLIGGRRYEKPMLLRFRNGAVINCYNAGEAVVLANELRRMRRGRQYASRGRKR
jgi:hypothetical protein